MDLIDRIGNYFAEQELQLQNVIDQAIEVSKRLYEEDEEQDGRSPRFLHHSSSQQRLLSATTPHGEKPAAAEPTNQHQALLSMYETEVQDADELYAQVVDVTATAHRRRVRKKRKKKKNTHKKAEAELAAIAAQKKLQAERQRRHAEAFKAVQERALKIQVGRAVCHNIPF